MDARARMVAFFLSATVTQAIAAEAGAKRIHLSDKSSVLACKVPVANYQRLDRFETTLRWHRRPCRPESSTASQTSVEVRARRVLAAYLSFSGSLRTRGSTRAPLPRSSPGCSTIRGLHLRRGPCIA